MPNVASIAVLPVHASPKEKESTGGEQDTVRPDFARLFREKAASPQSRVGSAVPASTANPTSQLHAGRAAKESSFIEFPAADQGESVPEQASPEAAIGTEKKQPAGTPHAGISNRLPVKSAGKGRPASEIEIADVTSPAGATTGKAEGASARPSEGSTTPGREKIQSTHSDGKTKTATLLPNPEQIVMTTFLPILSIRSAVGGTSAQSGDGAESIPKQETPQGAQNSGGKTRQLQMGEYNAPAAQSAVHGPGDSEIDQVAPSDNESEFDIPAPDRNEMVPNSANHSDSFGLSVCSAPVAVHADSRKLLAKTGATGTPPVTSASHVSTEAVVSGGQPAGLASSPVASVMSAAVNSAVTATPYDRIDQGAAPVVLHSGAQHVSVGVQDPDLGWVEIQTQSAAGHVDATLITASGQTHASLAAQLPAMAQYLEQRNVRVGALVVHHHAAGGSGAGSGGSGYGSANNGAGGRHSNPGNSGGDRTPPRYGGHVSENLSSTVAMSTRARPVEEGSAFRAVSYISVRA